MRKSFIFFFTSVICLSSIHGIAQTISAGVKGGISIPNLTSGGDNNPLNTGYSSSLGPDAALFGEYGISKLFSVELSLEYSFQGGQKKGKQALPVTPDVAALFPPNQAPPYLWANFNAKAKFDYLLIPVLGKFGFDFGGTGAWRAYIGAGPFVGFLLSAKTITSGSSNVYADEAETQPLLQEPTSFDATTDITDSLRSFNWGVAANIGIAYRFDRHSIFIEGGGTYGFIIVQKNKADGQNHTGSGNIRIGYAYTFGGGSSQAGRKVQSPKVFN